VAPSFGKTIFVYKPDSHGAEGVIEEASHGAGKWGKDHLKGGRGEIGCSLKAVPRWGVISILY